MGIIVLVVIVIAIAAVAMSRSKKPDRTENMVKPTEPVEISDQIMVKAASAKPEEKKAEKKKEEAEEPKEINSGKTVYYWLNGLTRQMFYYYRNEIWNEMSAVDPMEAAEHISIEEVKGNLGDAEAALFDSILQCVSPIDGKVMDSEGLKEVFFGMVLPFYPMYYHVFGNDIRYTAFLNKKTLGLFHQLSGKKFRVGYRNRYATGVTGFEWKGDRYRVFQKDGTLVCDAVFKDHKLYNGYGTVRMDELSEEAWKVEKTGYWQDGSFVKGKIHYLYQIACN